METNWTSRLLRIGLASVFLYAALGSLLSPQDWLWYLPDWILKIAPAEPLLMSHALFELLLGVWLLSGKKTMYAALLAAADLLIIVLSTLSIMDVVFRDVGLIFAALALATLHKERK